VHNPLDVLGEPAVGVGEQSNLVHSEPIVTIAFLEPAEYHDNEIASNLRANLRAAGIVTIRTGPLLEGELCGARFVVEDGGGLHASLRVEATRSKP
jgi:hypothetical protein